jgi:hypothetical protein
MAGNMMMCVPVSKTVLGRWPIEQTAISKTVGTSIAPAIYALSRQACLRMRIHATMGTVIETAIASEKASGEKRADR